MSADPVTVLPVTVFPVTGLPEITAGADLAALMPQAPGPASVAVLHAQVDGEDIGDLTEAEIVAHRDALTVLT